MKVVVLKGGSSLEREVSLRSAARVEDAVAALGHEALGIDVGPDLVSRLREERPDVVFIALHGPGGEDGTVQELLEILELPYTGPGVAACALCMDKVAAKHEMRAAGIPTPDWAAFNATAFRELGAADTLEEIEARLGFPLVVKPASQGSSLGVEFAAARDECPPGPGRGLQLRRPGAARALREGTRARRRRARRRCPAGRRGHPARGGLLQLRGPLRDRAHRLRLPRRARRCGDRTRPGARDGHLRDARLQRLRARRPDARARTAPRSSR